MLWINSYEWEKKNAVEFEDNLFSLMVIIIKERIKFIHN